MINLHMAERDRGDFFSEGCPCGLKQETVIGNLNRLQGDYAILSINEQAKQTFELFKRGGLNFEFRAIAEFEEIAEETWKILCELFADK